MTIHQKMNNEYGSLTNEEDTISSFDTSKCDRVQNVITASLFINIVLLVLKTWAAYSSGSLAVLSSLIDSILDLTSQALFWFTDKYVKKSLKSYYS